MHTENESAFKYQQLLTYGYMIDVYMHCLCIVTVD